MYKTSTYKLIRSKQLNRLYQTKYEKRSLENTLGFIIKKEYNGHHKTNRLG